MRRTHQDQDQKKNNNTTGSFSDHQFFFGHTKEINQLAADEKSLFLLSASIDLTINKWNIDTAELLESFEIPFSGIARILRFSGETCLSFYASDSEMFLRMYYGANCHHGFPSNVGCLLALALSHNQEHLFVNGLERDINQWSVKTGKKVATLLTFDWDLVKSLSLSQDDTLLFGSTDRSIYIWCMKKRSLIGAFSQLQTDLPIRIMHVFTRSVGKKICQWAMSELRRWFHLV